MSANDTASLLAILPKCISVQDPQGPVSLICISSTGNPESGAVAKAPPSPLKHKPEHKTNGPKQIQEHEPETKVWIEIPEMEEEIKRDIVYPWQSKQSEPNMKWDPLSYRDPGVPTSGLAEEFKTNNKMRVSHVKINKYQRRVTQYHTHI